MNKDIIEAIQYLPEEFLTPEIVQAGIENGNIELLNCLPQKYLTPEVVLQLVEKDKGYGSFDLKRIPKSALSVTVCEAAVEKSIKNFWHVPDKFKSPQMLNELMLNAPSTLAMLPSVPAEHWTEKAVYKGINALYAAMSSWNNGYSQKHRYSNYHESTDSYFRMAQILLSYVPATIKREQFYLGLFASRMSTKDVVEITPTRYKNKAFYIRLAETDFELLPHKLYSKDTLLAALRSGGVTPYDIFYKTNPYSEAFISNMDDEMADVIVEKGDNYFKRLPEQFRTEQRLLKAIDGLMNRDGYNLIDQEKDAALLSRTVCKAFVKKDKGYPTFPNKVWDQAFANYCLKNAPSFDWFEQMPGYLQTAENTALAMDKYDSNIQYVRPEFIPLERAQRIYRRDLLHHPNEEVPPLEKYIPRHYFSEFTELTGLPKVFFGGETTFLEMRMNKQRYSYCHLGNIFLGVYTNSGYRNAQLIVTMTRRTPDSIRPQTIFDRPVGTFHTTWLEKMVADYDRTFAKPAVSKKLKELQVNSYYEVRFVESHNGTDIYRNTFLEETVCYTALCDNERLCGQAKADLYDQLKSQAA